MQAYVQDYYLWVKEKELEKEDPLVMKIAEEGSVIIEYLEMLNVLENDTETKDLPYDK